MRMKTLRCLTASLLVILLSAAVSLAQDPGWPRRLVQNGNVLVLYQPQVDEWRDFRELDWRMAVSLTPAGGKAALGVVEMHGQTIVDNDSKMVLIGNIKIKRTYFPALDPARASQMEALAKKFLPPSVTISLQRLVAGVSKAKPVAGVRLRNEPPLIFVSYRPAIVLDVDGQPVRAPVRDTGLEYVVNTHWPLFFDPQSSKFYLLAGEQWMTAEALGGPWEAAKKLPKDMSKAVKEPQWAELKKFVPPPSAKRKAVVPTVFYATAPAEVILFDGKPAYDQVPGTGLRYARNTTSYVFLHEPTGRYYYLTAGRWFRADGLGGPWAFATNDLPADFARIPRNSPAAQVLASVPGTEEARDAVLLAQVPTTVTVNPAAAAAAVKVTYAGTPQFVVIEGTTLYYATNTPQTVIRVGDLYYLCFQGIWFVSTTPQGPWQTAKTVPPVIYTIPPSSPVYNVVYVTQVVNPDGTVQVSYTAGYTGAYVMAVETEVIIVGGTGYYYAPYVFYYPGYVYPVYYPMPYTYGYMSYYYTPTGAYGVSQTVYGPYGSATRSASYNPYTGTYTRSASVSTPYGTAMAGRAYNPYTGAAAATRQGSNAYASWGSTVVTKDGKSAYGHHYSTDQGTVASVKTSEGGKAIGKSTASGKTVAAKTAGGDMYAGHDGNVYRNTGSGWEKYDNGNWTPVTPPDPSTAKQQAQDKRQGSQKPSGDARQQQTSYSGPRGGGEHVQGLQEEAQGRQRGEQSSQRFQDFQRSGGDGARGAGGGGFRGGGGRGRR